jgi:hypothetical protein
MQFEDLNPEQMAALAESLEVPEGISLAEYLEEAGADITLTRSAGSTIYVRTDDQGGVNTGQLVFPDGVWIMRWDFWTH